MQAVFPACRDQAAAPIERAERDTHGEEVAELREAEMGDAERRRAQQQGGLATAAA